MGKLFQPGSLYGSPTTFPGTFTSRPGAASASIRITKYPEATTLFHPLFLYESIWNLINMAFLLWIARRFEKWLKPGDLFYHLHEHVFHRTFRPGFPAVGCFPGGGINFNQTFVAIVALVAGGLLVFLNHRPRRAKAE